MNKQGKEKIEYLDYTWSPITGCLNPCKYCYARKIAHRFGGTIETAPDGGLHVLDEPIRACNSNGKFITSPYPYMFDPTFHRYRLDGPQKVKKPSIIGVVYMGEIFGDWVPDSWIREVFKACEAAPWHTYLFLTKNPGRMSLFLSRYTQDEIKNWWFGTTITNQADIQRIAHLPLIQNRFISVEPILGEIDFDKRPLHIRIPFTDWVIIGMQTNPNRPPKDEWVQSIIDQCRAAGVPVFVKRPLYDKFPIQEWPEGLK